MAVLTEKEKEEFEEQIAKNQFKAMGIHECPKCKSMVVRENKNEIRLTCIPCSTKKGKRYEFCWHCLNEWYNGSSRTQCGKN